MTTNALTELLWVYVLSLIPSFEGRYAVVVGLAMGLSPSGVMTAASLGVLTLSLILPKVLPKIDDLMNSLARSEYGLASRLGTTYLRYVGRVRGRVKPYVSKWGFIGLTIFVAVPLPGTGVWTGALAAYVLGMRGRGVVTALILGGLLSNVITLVPTLLTTKLIP